MAVAPVKKSRGLADLKDVSALIERRGEIKEIRAQREREWALNRAFFNGDQWVIWNRVTSQVESLPVAEGDKPRWKVRLTDNQVRPGVQHYVALMTKNRPVIHALPDSGGDKDVKSAQVGEALYDWWWKELDLTAKLQSALTHSQLSEGYWLISYDPFAGKPMKVCYGPDGRPIANERLADVYKDELRAAAEEAGMPPEALLGMYEKTMYTGDIRIDVFPGERVYIDPAAQVFDDAKYAIVEYDLDVDEIYSRWKVRVEPDSTPVEEGVPLAYRRASNEKKLMVTRKVYIGYFRPSPALPEGRYVAWIEGPDKILADVAWPFPFRELPLVRFPGMERPNSPTDDPRVSMVRPIQKELNRTLSQIVQHKDLAIKPQMLVPFGSLRQKLTDEPGAAIEYNPVGQQIPQWRDIPQLPPFAFELLNNVQQRIDRLFNRIPATRESLPARTDSGNTVELIQEAVADQMTPEIRRLEGALARAGYLMVCLARKYYTEQRTIKIVGLGGSVKTRKFLNSDIEGGFSFHPVMDTGLPRTRAGRIQTVKELMEMQLIDPRTALKHLDLGEFRGIHAQIAADEDQAEREHDKLLRGEPINQYALQQVLSMVEQGINPQTGELVQDEAELPMIQQAIQEAALQPLPFEDKAAHLQVHDLYMKSVEFEKLPPEQQAQLIQHRELTAAQLSSETPPDPKSLPGMNLTAKATVSAPVFRQILEKHGIQVTEEEVEAQPLETAVYDSVDKPDAEEAGNDALTPQDIAAYAQSLQSADQEAEMHSQRLRKASADADRAEKQAQDVGRED